MRKRPLHIRLLTGLILLAFLTQSFSRTWVVADYWLNTGYYAARCVNKARPEMHCNGKCQMMKHIREEERKDAENQERLSEKFETTPLSSRHFIAEILSPAGVSSLSEYPPYMASKPSIGHVFRLLRPPSAA